MDEHRHADSHSHLPVQGERVRESFLVSESEQNQSVTADERLKKLTPAARTFSELYAVNHNVLKSSVLAGCHEDYGHQLLKRPEVQWAVEYFRALHLERAMYTESKLLRQWALMASVNPLDYVTEDYELKRLDQLTLEQREHLGMALVGLEVTEKAGKRYVRAKYAKVEALENIGKLMRLYDDKMSDGEGLTLNIHLGQGVNAGQSEGSAEDLGPFTVRMPRTDQDGGG